MFVCMLLNVFDLRKCCIENNLINFVLQCLKKAPIFQLSAFAVNTDTKKVKPSVDTSVYVWIYFLLAFFTLSLWITHSPFSITCLILFSSNATKSLLGVCGDWNPKLEKASPRVKNHTHNPPRWRLLCLSPNLQNLRSSMSPLLSYQQERLVRALGIWTNRADWSF